MHAATNFIKSVWPASLMLLLLVAGWSGVKWFWDIADYFVPYPWDVAAAGVRIGQELLGAVILTGQAAVIGFVLSVILGSLVAILFSQFQVLRLGCFPFAVILQTVPIVAVAPLITYAWGAGTGSVIFIAFVVSLFPIIANVTAGISSVPTPLRELFQLYHGRRIDIILKLEIPHAIPDLVTGMRTSGGLAVIGAIVGEFFAGNSSEGYGLGFMVPQRISQFKADEAFAAVLCAVLLGITMFSCVSLLRETLLARWCRPLSRR